MAGISFWLVLLAVSWKNIHAHAFSLAISFVHAELLPRRLQSTRTAESLSHIHGTLARDARTRPRNQRTNCRSTSPRDDVVTAEDTEYLRNKEALKQDLRYEYESFFDNFASERYLPNVEFIDPITSFTGFENYKRNVDMLGGRSLLGKILFKDSSIVLHSIEEPGPFQMRTRWTLSVCFNILPWKPVARFTGISEYTVDNRARVVRQVDYWDSINLIEGRYKSVSPLEGVKDFVGQVLPSQESKAPGKRKGIVGDLLRRAKDYDVRLYQAGGGEHGASSGLASPQVVASREFDGDATAEAVAHNRWKYRSRSSEDLYHVVVPWIKRNRLARYNCLGMIRGKSPHSWKHHPGFVSNQDDFDHS